MSSNIWNSPNKHWSIAFGDFLRAEKSCCVYQQWNQKHGKFIAKIGWDWMPRAIFFYTLARAFSCWLKKQV